MGARLKASFLDFATLGPDIDTSALDQLVEVAYHAQSTAQQIPERLGGAAIAIVNKATLTAQAIAGARSLKLIVLSATGTDNVDLAAARERGVAVANIRDYCSVSVAQHVVGLILELTHHIGRYDALVRAGAWQRSERFALFDYPIRELTGRRLGIIGYGALGQAVARAGACLGMQVLIAARRGTPPGSPPPGRQPFEAVLERSDVLSLHCPLTASNRHMIAAAELARMKPDALLINTARGALVDSVALVAALRRGELGGAGIDVLPTEPPADGDPLLSAQVPHLILTPHIAWAAREARQRALDQVVENIRDFTAGGRLRRIV